MESRLQRQDTAVLGLLSDSLRQALETGRVEASRTNLLQVSNPCWYRYETLRLEQATRGIATVWVRVYQHFWGGDLMGGLPNSWEQQITLVETPSGWQVDRLSEPQNKREEPDEPHGAALSACNAPGAATPFATPTASEAANHSWTSNQPMATPYPAPDPLTPAASDNAQGYVSGRVISIAPDHLVVRTADKGDVKVYPAFYRIWDDLWVKDIPTEVGDEITALDAAFGGPQLYVNLVNLIGTISNVRQEADSVMFEMNNEVRYTGQRSTDTVKVEQRARVSGSGPRESQRGQVVGRRLEDGSVLAVTVFYFDADATRDVGPIPTMPPTIVPEPTAGVPKADTTQSSPDAWTKARAGLPSSVPVYRPAFIPERFGPATLEEVQNDTQFGPRYTIVYRAEDELVAFILGMGKGALGNSPPPDVTEPITILGAWGQLSTIGATATRSRLSLEVAWQEQGRSYQIKASSNHMTKDELLRIVAGLTAVK